jgi:hypothetical protein
VKVQTVTTILLALAIMIATATIALNLSLFGIFPFTEKATGYSTVEGTVELSKTGVTGITVTTPALEFGSGKYNSSCTQEYAVLDSTKGEINDEDCWVNSSAYPTEPQYHTIENTGSNTVKITAIPNVDDAEMLFCPNDCEESESAKVSLRVVEAEEGSCKGATKEFTTLLSHNSAKSITICDELYYPNSIDTIHVGIRMHVPPDASEGEKYFSVNYQAQPL